MGRRVAARLHRVPARVVAQLADLRRHAGAAGAARAAADWGAGRRNFTSLYLEPLSAEAMEQLLAGLVPGLPGSCATQILARAEGVPLYAVETVRMLLDRGAARPGGRRLPADRRRSSARGARDAAGADRRAPRRSRRRRSAGVVQDAAVLGKTFTKQALAPLTGLPRRSSSRSRLARPEGGLRRPGRPRSPEHGQYGFLQDLLRQVAYETLARSRAQGASPRGRRVSRAGARGERGGRRGRRLALPRRLRGGARRGRRCGKVLRGLELDDLLLGGPSWVQTRGGGPPLSPAVQ